jgi:hypothetical protein
MALRVSFMWVIPKYRPPIGSFSMPRNWAFLTPALRNGSNPAHLLRRICASTLMRSPLPQEAALNPPASIFNNAATWSAGLKLTLRAQAPYTFSS